MTHGETILKALTDPHRDDTKRDAVRITSALELLLDVADRLVAATEEQQRHLEGLCNSLWDATEKAYGFVKLRNKMH